MKRFLLRFENILAILVIACMIVYRIVRYKGIAHLYTGFTHYMIALPDAYLIKILYTIVVYFLYVLLRQKNKLNHRIAVIQISGFVLLLLNDMWFKPEQPAPRIYYYNDWDSVFDFHYYPVSLLLTISYFILSQFVFFAYTLGTFTKHYFKRS